MISVEEKLINLKNYFKEIGKIAIAFSGGVDSTFLVKAAKDAIGADNVLAVTAASGLFPHHEKTEAEEFCREEGIRQIVLEIDELQVEGFAENPPNRCYICKMALFSRMKERALLEGFPVLAEGSNMDDLGDYRPGLLAVSELGLASPLRICGLTKQDIRDLSAQYGLATWDKPSFACLASRFAYGETITAKKLEMVGKAEAFLFAKGFRQGRIRIHGMMARIEVMEKDFARFLEPAHREEFDTYLKSLGFTYVSLDLRGYRTGSMNEALKNK